MATADFFIKQGDTLPVLSDTLTYSNGSAVNLTGASVNFIMRALTASATTTNAAATIVTPASGTVQYTFTATDSATAGTYMANWFVTFSGGTTMTFPTDGYISVNIEENLTTPGGAMLLSLPEAKDHLNIPTADRTRDAKLLNFITELTPVIENFTGPILQRVIQNEKYDIGPGTTWISLRNRPMLSLQSVTEYRGPIPYPLTQVATPDLGAIYSYEWESTGRVVRRTVGGGVTAFPAGITSVYVSYTAGRSAIPPNITGAVKELLRVHFQDTQQGPPRAGGGSFGQQDLEPTQEIMGFFISGKVREMLQPSRRHPSIA